MAENRDPASPSRPAIIGFGVVVGVGDAVDRFSSGDAVIVIPSQQVETGSWVDYRCVHNDMVMRSPPSLSHVDAAAITMAVCVPWGAAGFGHVDHGHRCAVIGASGSTGIMIVQHLKALVSQVTAVCSGTNDALAHRDDQRGLAV